MTVSGMPSEQRAVGRQWVDESDFTAAAGYSSERGLNECRVGKRVTSRRCEGTKRLLLSEGNWPTAGKRDQPNYDIAASQHGNVGSPWMSQSSIRTTASQSWMLIAQGRVALVAFADKDARSYLPSRYELHKTTSLLTATPFSISQLKSTQRRWSQNPYKCEGGCASSILSTRLCTALWGSRNTYQTDCDNRWLHEHVLESP